MYVTQILKRKFNPSEKKINTFGVTKNLHNICRHLLNSRLFLKFIIEKKV